MTSRAYFLASCVFGGVALTACGGGGGGAGGSGGGTATGVFKDSNVSGLTYVSGTQSGVTGPGGGYSYEVGQPVTFSIGGVTIGTVDGDTVLTPVDLVTGGNTDATQVKNIVRFLMMLDSDGDASNGITISPEVQEIAAGWSQVDFSTADLATELAGIISDAASVDGVPHALPSADAAKAHLESTFLCTHAGAYLGAYTGGDSGRFGVLIEATSGLVAGIANSNFVPIPIALSGAVPISFDQKAAFVTVGGASTGATFSGQFLGADDIGGTWENAIYSLSGGFSGTRIGGTLDAVYRFTGVYEGDDYGLITFDVDGTDNVTGVAYSLAGGEQFALSGNLNGSSLSATASDGTTITGTLDKTKGEVSGSWVDGGLAGSYVGSGCKLN